MNPVIYQGMQPGGQLTTTEVKTGRVILKELRVQKWWCSYKLKQRFGTDVRDGWATKVDFSGDIHKVWINDTIELHCETVISTGATAAT
jgi:thioredoxin reductase (NADPH)